MSEQRDKIIEFCKEYLKILDFQDYCCNGLQVEGKAEIGKIVTGVSLSRQLIVAASERNADMIMVHHGIFVNDVPSPLQLTGLMKDRIKLLLEKDINLAGFHLPLDAHPVIGNNISICKMLGVKKTKPFDVGFVGELDKEMDFDKFRKLVGDELCTQTFAIAAGKKKVRKIAVISGGASPDFEEASVAGADVFITGDVREEVVRKIEEVGINFINAGHYNTEKEGIKNLGKLVAQKFKVEAEFVDIPNIV